MIVVGFSVGEVEEKERYGEGKVGEGKKTAGGSERSDDEKKWAREGELQGRPLSEAPTVFSSNRV